MLRVRAREVGVLQLVLQCLSLASHHSPRVEGEAVGNISLESGYVSLFVSLFCLSVCEWRERQWATYLWRVGM